MDLSLSSWWMPKVPYHDCQQCGMTHRIFKPITIRDDKFFPYELCFLVLGTMEEDDPEFKGRKRAYPVLGRIWQLPGGDPTMSSDRGIIGLN